MEVKDRPDPSLPSEKEMRKDPEAEWRLKVQEQGDINARTVRSLWDAGGGRGWLRIKPSTFRRRVPVLRMSQLIRQRGSWGVGRGAPASAYVLD